MKHLRLLLLFTLFTYLAQAQTPTQTTLAFDTVNVKKTTGTTNAELNIFNGTRALNGAFLQNYKSGRTKFAYAVDDARIEGGHLIIHRGDGDHDLGSVGSDPDAITTVTQIDPTTVHFNRANGDYYEMLIGGGGGSDGFYTTDGTLTGNRSVAVDGHNISFDNANNFAINATDGIGSFGFSPHYSSIDLYNPYVDNNNYTNAQINANVIGDPSVNLHSESRVEGIATAMEISVNPTSIIIGGYSANIIGGDPIRQGLRVNNDGTTTFNAMPVYASNAAAITGGLAVGTLYRNGDDIKIVH